ncbi:MAG: hypothetical protein L0Y72_07630 [Gemmataceae bacterium]|nr:hypothetical protein [Gemmataceae bacterium]MCI0738899.1 hypothetical protein [Gemmataceae bacterium]
MAAPLSERQRQALRDFKQAAAARARQEIETETSYKERTHALERDFQERTSDIERSYRDGIADLQTTTDQTRARLLQEALTQERTARKTFEKAKRDAAHAYAEAKEQTLADFKETRWTVTTMFDAGRKVARDQLNEAHVRAKTAVEQLAAQQQEALELLQFWQFANELPAKKQASPAAQAADPWQGLQTCATQANSCLAYLKALSLPKYVRGALPYLVLCLVWLLLSLPALVVSEWYYWLAATTLTVWPIGLLVRWWLVVRARAQAVFLWSGLAQAMTDALALRQRAIDQAKEQFRLQRLENRRRHQESLNQVAAQAKSSLQALRKARSRSLKNAHNAIGPRQKQIAQERDQALADLENDALRGREELNTRHEDGLRELAERTKRARDESNRKHADDWTRMVSGWKNACDQFFEEVRAIDHLCRRWFPAWDDPHWINWHPPGDIPLALPVGKLDVRLEDIPHGVPKSHHLQKLDLDGISFPCLLPFPERSSLLLKAVDRGKSVGLRALQALLLRSWTALPAGKVRCTILDPVGRGENFGAFMHLADFEEALVNSRIWTEPEHIEQRLADLTSHMETVLQKYLRNQFQTLAEYNAQAGEVAEPFRFLVVADFPVNFTPDAARRLLSLATAGARCGIYTFIMADTRQTLPQGIEMEDLERGCTTLTWKGDHFGWNDPDFGAFPLSVDKAPPPETCTHLLQTAGEHAKLALRVELPFDILMPAADEWWQGDSRGGVSVPLGQAGATAKQYLSLGQGTAQHALIAGKTGSGKSTLLHVLITQLALRYSPDQVELYLIDFKKGVEFKTYAVNQLPHARVVAIESEREFGLSVLQRLDAELVRRGEMFRQAGVNDLPSYRSLRDQNGRSGKSAPLPRLVLIVDEFQEFFVEDDKLAQEAALLLDRLVRQGRAFGMHILLGSQTLGGAYSLARSTIDQMGVRIALQCSETDAHLILSKDNSEARLLSRPGEAIYNAAGGLLEGNHLFQIVWLDEERRDDCLRTIRRRADAREIKGLPIVFEGSAPSEVAQNALLRRAWDEPKEQTPSAPLHAWLGEAVAIKDPTAAVFRRHSGSNLLLVGQKDEAAFSVTVAALAALAAQLPAPANGTPLLNLVVANPLEGDADAVFRLLPEVLPVRVVSQRELPAFLSQWGAELERRLQGENGPAQFLFLHGLQRVRELRRPDDDFGFSKKGEALTPYKQLQQILRDGPPLGLFTALWCDTLANLQRTFDRQALREFEMRVLFQMSVSDSSTLMDSPVAGKLGMHRAILFTEDQGRMEKFRPYGLPSAEWLRELGQKKVLVG